MRIGVWGIVGCGLVSAGLAAVVGFSRSRSDEPAAPHLQPVAHGAMPELVPPPTHTAASTTALVQLAAHDEPALIAPSSSPAQPLAPLRELTGEPRVLQIEKPRPLQNATPEPERAFLMPPKPPAVEPVPSAGHRQEEELVRRYLLPEARHTSHASPINNSVAPRGAMPFRADPWDEVIVEAEPSLRRPTDWRQPRRNPLRD